MCVHASVRAGWTAHLHVRSPVRRDVKARLGHQHAHAHAPAKALDTGGVSWVHQNAHARACNLLALCDGQSGLNKSSAVRASLPAQLRRGCPACRAPAHCMLPP